MGRIKVPTASDMRVIRGATRKIPTSGPELDLKMTFSSGGWLRAPHNAVLSLMVKGLTSARGHAAVELNESEIGRVYNSNDANKNHWHSPIITFPASKLFADGSPNRLRIHPAESNKPSIDHDIFHVKAVMCHFMKQI